MSASQHRVQARIVWAIFALALVLRSVAWTRTSVIFNDGPTFIALAKLMEAGEWAQALAHPYHPLYPILVRGMHGIVPDWEMAASLVSILGGSLAVVGLHQLLRAAFDTRVANIGALLLALHPYAIRFSADVQSDSLHLAFLLFSTALLYRGLRDARPALALASGALSGLAYLTRPEGAAVVVVGLTVTMAAFLRGGWKLAAALRFGGALLAGLTLPALPYLLALRVQAGGWRFSQKKSVLELIGIDAGAAAEAPDLPGWLAIALLLLLLTAIALAWQRLTSSRTSERPRARIGARALAGAAALCALAAALLAPAQAADFTAVFVSTLRPELLLLAALGIGTLVRDGPRGRALFFAAFEGLYAVLLFGLLLHYGYLSRRHALPPVALLMGYCALGVVWVARRLEQATGGAHDDASPPNTRWIAIGLFAIAAASLPKAWSDHRKEELAGRRAAEWLAAHDEGAGLLASQRSKLGYYAERDWRPLAAEGQPRPIEILRAEGVRWLIADGREPQPVAPHPALVERHRIRANDRDAVVYELSPEQKSPSSE